MAHTDTFKVIIAGGGMAGLTLANMLEKFDIDYVLLESHSAIAPAVGASIGMFPNGMRILDQIGCYQAVEDIFSGNIPYNTQKTRDENGDVVGGIDDLPGKLEERHGYKLFFFDRQKMLEILHDNLEHKDKVLLNKRVSSVDLVGGGVDVSCADGSVFSGSIVVGSDGIHSSVRGAMTAIANKIQPGYFDPSEPDSVPCYYRCSFGIAQHVPGWVTGELYHVTGKERSQLVISGPDNKVYWFMFEKLFEVKYGKDIPRYTKKDEEEFVKRNADVPITRRVTFGQVYAKRLSSTLTPLHEVVYKKWFFKRMITLGDSAHKPNPIGGQGGNGALESSAELVNALLRAKDRRHGNLAALTEGDIEIVFRETQEARHARAHLVVKDAHDTQALFAWENTVLSTFVFKLTQPVFGGEAIVDLMSSVIMGASKVDKLPVPPRRHIIPWHDELPAKPVDARTHDLVRKAFLSVMALIVIIGLKPLQLPIPELERWSKSAVGLRWFGDNAINDFFNMLVGVLVVPVEGGGISTNVQLWNFIPQLISPLMIWGIEGYRAGHRATPLALPALYSVLMQVQGIGRVAPIYAALSSFFTHDTPLGRTIPRNVADSLIPAITLGFTIPTLMALTPNPNVSAWHGWNLIWQASPPLFNFLLSLGATGLGWWRGRGQTEAKKPKKEPAPPRSGHDFVPALKTAYSYAFAVQATTHIASVAYGWHHPDVNLATIFFGLLSPFSDNWGLPTVGATMSAVLKYDMFLAMAAFLGSNLYSIWDLRRLGYVRTRESVKAALLLVAGQLVVGPGASWAGLWYWREGKIAAASKEN